MEHRSGLEPASSIIAKLGGPSKVAAVVGVHPTRVSNWKRARASGGTGGRIPQAHHLVILRAAKECGAEITAEDLLPREGDAA
ncbi:carph-isopro domain-containing protein [Rhodoblastus sp.]|uniref:carph-isopro domain-containing protein n=1 Tax=Rhodoblastus sp. TaxID=1962975 RepID=UPI003F9B921E